MKAGKTERTSRSEQTIMQKSFYQPESYTGFHIWLLCMAVILFACSFYPDELIQKDQVQTIGMLVLVMIDFLYLLMLASQSIYWLGTVKYEEAAQADAKERRLYALKQLLWFAAGTIAYLIYCCAPGSPSGAAITDAIAGAVCICIPAVMAVRIKL